MTSERRIDDGADHGCLPAPRPATNTATGAPPGSGEHLGGDPTRFPWIPVLALGFAWFLGVAIELGPSGLLTGIAADLDVSIAAAGTLTTSYALGNAILVLPLTALVVRFPRRPTLVVVMAVLVLSTLVVAVAPSLPVADGGRFLGGGAYAVMCTLFPAVIVRTAGPGHAGKAITVAFTATSLGTALGGPLASLTGGAFGWRATFLGAAALVLVAGVLMTLAVPPLPGTRRGGLSVLQTARLPGVLRVAVGWSLVMLAHFVVLTYIDAYLQDLGAPRYLTSLTLLVIGVGGIVGTLAIGVVSARSAAAALLVAPVLVALGFVVLLLGGEHLVAALAGVLLWGVGVSAVVVVYQKALLLTGARAPESATSIGVLLAQSGFAAGATIGGITLSTVGLRAVPLVALLFVLASILIAVTLRPAIAHAESLAPG